ncbi:MAG: type II secretion system F family protein [Chlamydiales bacterium]|nr:type II secretion system F family protein [Chlamydiia bacterium]MCP5507969.1 type II secretion system F family protein [Chlamydiales bacterium]
MPLFYYEAIDRRGKKLSGVVEGQNDREARQKLRDQGIMVTNLSSRAKVSSKENLRGENLMTFTLQLSQLVGAGVPLYESLIAIEEQYRGEKYHRVLLSLCEQIKSGTRLSEAMAAFPDSFDRLYRAMITAGESAGALDIVLERLSIYLQKRDKLKKQITTALIYPSIIASFSLVIIGLLLGFVVPSIEGIFSERDLNGFTRFILDLSHFAQAYWWAYIPLIGGLVTFLVMKIRSPSGKIWIERNFLYIPVIKTLMVQAAIARFCRTMGTLQVGGLTMIDSLRIARESMGNVVLEEVISEAEARIVEGSSLSAELTGSKWIPAMVSRMLAVGEDTGNTSAIFNKIADMYEEEMEKSLDRAMALAQPLILIVMGSIIGVILIAILLPLTDVSALAV